MLVLSARYYLVLPCWILSDGQDIVCADPLDSATLRYLFISHRRRTPEYLCSSPDNLLLLPGQVVLLVSRQGRVIGF